MKIPSELKTLLEEYLGEEFVEKFESLEVDVLEVPNVPAYLEVFGLYGRSFCVTKNNPCDYPL